MTQWHRDPIVGLLTLVGIIACASVVFTGRYLPYPDWAGHVSLSAVLAYGDLTGADAYLTRSWIPTPYYLFYATNAAMAAVLPVEVAAKTNLLIATGVATLGAARLAEAAGRSPRLCGLAPLMLFGSPLGLGFASFVIGLPWLLHALAEVEHLLRNDGRPWPSTLRLSLFLTLCFVGHGLVFVFAALLIGARTVISILHRPTFLRPVLHLALSGVVVVLVALPSVQFRLQRRYVSPEFLTPEGTPLAGWLPLSEHFKHLGHDLLDRGGDGHGVTIAMVVVVTALTWALVVASRFGRGSLHPSPRPSWTQDGLLVYALVATALFFFGPVWLGWPVTFWVVYARAGSLAAVLIALLPPADLRGRLGTVIALLAMVPVVHNAAVNRPLIQEYSTWAKPYDEVRKHIPPGQRVLGLSLGVRSPGQTLYFYHLVDGATYVPVGNTPEEVPVHRRNVPGTPYNPDARNFDPRTHGRMYDYVVVHGAGLAARLDRAGTHHRVTVQGPWTVYKTRSPLPPAAIRW